MVTFAPKRRTSYQTLIPQNLGGKELDEELDRIYEEFERFGQSVAGLRLLLEEDPEETDPAEDEGDNLGTNTIRNPGFGRRMRNKTTSTIARGTVIGLNASRNPVAANAVSTGVIRPLCITANPVPPKGEVIPVWGGLVPVLLESGVTLSTTNVEAVWLSASEAGRVTNSAPAGPNRRFLLGMFSGTLRSKSGLVEIAFTPYLSASTSV